MFRKCKPKPEPERYVLTQAEINNMIDAINQHAERFCTNRIDDLATRISAIETDLRIMQQHLDRWLSSNAR